MTSLKSIMKRRTMQVLDVRDMRSLKGGNGGDTAGEDQTPGGGNPPADPDSNG